MSRNYSRFVVEALWQILLIVSISLVLSLSVNYLRRGPAPLVAGPSPKAVSKGEGPSGAAGYTVISIEEAYALYLTEGVLFVDARPEEVYRSGHIKGAVNLPPESIGESLTDFMAKTPAESLIVTYCDGENCTLSEETALQLSAGGCSHVQVLKNGWSLWRQAGLPMESSPALQPPHGN